MRTIVQVMNEVSATPMVTAVMAATTDRDPSSTHDAVSPGLEMNRIPTMTGATSARTPRRRITLQGYAWRHPARTDRTYHERQAGSTPCPCGLGADGLDAAAAVLGPLRPAILRPPSHERAGPANPGGQRSRLQGASAVPRGVRATNRWRSSDGRCLSRSQTPRVWDLRFRRRPGAADARVGRLRRSFTHLQVRSL